jgi:hypothetical protein
MKLDRRSLLLLALQLALVSSIAAKYFYERHSCPRVWTRAAAYDPELVVRGRYLSMQLRVDACGLSSPHIIPELKGTPAESYPIDYLTAGELLDGRLAAKNGKLVVSEFALGSGDESYQQIEWRRTDDCWDAKLSTPVEYYVPEHAEFQFPHAKETSLWVEVTVPPHGPPRPIQLAVNDHGLWKPIKY